MIKCEEIAAMYEQPAPWATDAPQTPSEPPLGGTTPPGPSEGSTQPPGYPWDAIGWNAGSWGAAAYGLARSTAADRASKYDFWFGPGEESNPNLWVRQAFIKSVHDEMKFIKEDQDEQQKAFNDDAVMRRKAQDYARQQERTRRANGELTEAAKMCRDRIRSGMLDPEDLDDMDDPAPIVDGWIYSDTINWIAGPSGTFKSFVALDLAARYASESMSYHGFPMTHGKVLYVIAEGGGMFKHRKRAWVHFNGPMNRGNITFYPAPIQITDFDEEMPAIIDIAKEEGYKMVIFDTQAMCTVGDDENTAKDMGLLVNAVNSMREATGACVILVHHFDKGENGMRGSGAMFAAAHTVIATCRKDDAPEVRLSTLKKDHGKAKDDEGRDDLKLHMDVYTPEEGALDRKGRKLRKSLCAMRDDRYEKASALPVLDQERLALLEYIIHYEDMGGLTPGSLRNWLNEHYPKPNGKYEINTAETRAKTLITKECAVKNGSKWLPTARGKAVVAAASRQAAYDDYNDD